MTTSVVSIAGALTGIGRAMALAFAQKGARVVIIPTMSSLVERQDNDSSD
jgi:NAD(P)-dependent dehydrogenase (short-subunit alcohol dehydrogenase family)